MNIIESLDSFFGGAPYRAAREKALLEEMQTRMARDKLPGATNAQNTLLGGQQYDPSGNPLLFGDGKPVNFSAPQAPQTIQNGQMGQPMQNGVGTDPMQLGQQSPMRYASQVSLPGLLGNEALAPGEYAERKDSLLGQADPAYAALKMRLSDSDVGKTGQTLLAVDPSGKLYGDYVTKSAEPTPEQKLINFYNALPDGDPRKSYVKNIIDTKGGIETDPNKINETRANTAEKQAQTALAQSKQSLLSNSGLDEDTLDRIYQGVKAGQKINEIAPNLGRGQQGAKQIIDIQNYITKRMKSDGTSPAQIAAANVNLRAQASAQRKVAERTGVIDMASAELDAFVDQGYESLGKMDQSQFVPWNKLVNMTETELGDNPNLASYKTILSGIRGAYASVLQRGGATTVEALNSADKLLNTATGPNAAKAIFAQMKREAAAVHGAGNKVQDDIQSRITGEQAHVAPAQPDPTQAPKPLPPGMVKQVGTYKGKPVYEDQNGQKHVDMGQ